MIRFHYRFFRVDEQERRPGRRTREYRVVNVRSGDVIGAIRWYAPWRQFCFFPTADTVWSAGCLADLQDALRKADARRKAEG